MGHPRYTKEEIAARGKEIYEKQIRARVGPEHVGKFIVIDIETGDYEIDADDKAVSRRAYEKHPGSALYGMRIGHRAWGRIGAGATAQR